MTGSLIRQAGPVLARLILAIIFALSAASKLSAPGIFQADVQSYHLLPASLVGPFARALPWVEVLLAVYLLLGLFLRPVAVVTAGLLLVFTAALTIELLTGHTAHSCGCLQVTGLLASLPALNWLFGGTTITVFDVVRDLALASLAVAVYRGHGSALSLDAVLFSERSTDAAVSRVASPRYGGEPSTEGGGEERL